MREAALELVASFRETGKITDAHMDQLKLKIPRMIGDEGKEHSNCIARISHTLYRSRYSETTSRLCSRTKRQQ